ncbi:MAG: hypothetical protein PHS79_04690 [Patescibacteria group bacterium]|nr:hypothetical protein [Patescibacteria group bacterium]
MQKNKNGFSKLVILLGVLIPGIFVFLHPNKALADTCEMSGNNVTISVDCELYSDSYTYTGTLTVDPDITVTILYNSDNNAGATFTADDMVINGNFDLNGQGFPAGEGTGAGGALSGGGYGGTGGGDNGGITYGSETEPVGLGSGGSDGAGGGAIKLVAANITLNGTISANGASVFDGGGSGGSVWIVASNLFDGNGTVTANGANAISGGGGGGRISIASAEYGYSGGFSASPGTPGGQSGTLYVNIPNPTLTSLTPNQTAAGTTPGTVALNGANFELGASIKLDGASKETSYSDSENLSLLVFPTFGSAGTHVVQVYNSMSDKYSNELTFTVTNPAPTLEGLTPSSKFLADTDLDVTLTGTNFMETSQIFLGGSEKTFDYVDDTELTMHLSASDLNVASSQTITVVNPTPGGGTSNGVTFSVYAPSVSTGGVASPVAIDGQLRSPAAGYGKALGSDSIRWFFSNRADLSKGYQLINIDDQSVLKTINDKAAKYIDESGLAASTTYCNRGILAFSGTATSTILIDSTFPCVTTLPVTEATSSEFAVSPINVLSVDVESANLGWTSTSTELGKGRVYGLYLEDTNLWLNPDGSDASTTSYLFADKPFYQSIENWGTDFKLKNLNVETLYRLSIVGADVSSTSGLIVEIVSFQTQQGEISFTAEMEMIESSVQQMPTSTSVLLSLVKASKQTVPALGSVFFFGIAALVYENKSRSKKRKVTKVKKTTKKKSRARRTLMSMLLIMGTSAFVNLALSPLTAHAADVQTLTYQLKFSNTGTKTAKNVNVTDPIPQGAVYYPGSLVIDTVSQTDAQDGDNAWYGASQVNFHWDSVAPGVTHVMKFSVYLEDGVKYDQINNVATINPPDNADPATLPLIFHEQTICGNSKIEVKRDADGNPIIVDGQAQWEACDDGVNNGTGYGWCNSDCSAINLPPSNLCGNGKIDEWTNLKTNQSFKESCDEGKLNGDAGHCNLSCDGTVPPPLPKKEEEKLPEVIEQPPVISGAATSTVVEPTSTPIVEEAPIELVQLVQATTTPVASVQEPESPLKSLSQNLQKASAVLSSPNVKNTVIPVLGALMVIDVASAAGYMSLFNYLYYIFTQPLILISRRKKGKFGVIYNSLSKLPVDLAAVRIKNAAGKIVQTKITDKQGRYYFLLPKGQYEVDISKQGYSFPSGLLAGKTQDVDYIDLLTNNKLSFTADAFVANNIPIDPKEDARKPKDIKRKLTLRKVQGTAAVLTTLLSFGVFALVPTYQYLGLAVFQLLTYAVFRRLAYRKPLPSYGAILDQKTGKPIKSAVVRILDAQFNRILETQITDAQGRYAFLVGKGKFYITINKDGYEPVRSEAIDCSGSSSSVVIDKKIKLQPIK